MLKTNMYNQKQSQEKNSIYPKSYNIFTPPNTKQKHYLNNTNIKFKPINLNNKCFSPGQNEKNFSVKMVNSPEVKINMEMLGQYSSLQKNLNAKIFQSPETTHSDLLTSASFTNQQKSNESLLSISTNNSQYIPSNFQILMPNNYTICQFPCHRKIFSMGTPINYFCPINNGNLINNTIINANNQIKVNLNNQLNKAKKPIQNIYSNNVNINQNNNLRGSYDSVNCAKFEKNKQNINSSDSVKSGGSGNNSSGNSSKGSGKNNVGNKNGNLNNISKKKNFFNKFNSPKENSTNENTVILTLKIKVAPNDFRTFNLKKYDDLFVSLEKFFDLNKIKQELVKPIVTKIFAALNKIFWLLNNKIGIYDQEYLNSLYKLWVKNKEQLPKSQRGEKEKKEDEKINTENQHPHHQKNKNIISDDNSTISSSDSSDKNKIKKHKKLMSNSFQNVDTSTENERHDTIKSI